MTGLPDHCRALLASGKLSAGHARALLALPNPDAVADRIVAHGLSVRDVERMAQEKAVKLLKSQDKTQEKIDADTRALEAKLAVALGAKVTIRHSGESGEIRVKFENFEQLDDFCRRLSQPAPGSRG